MVMGEFSGLRVGEVVWAIEKLRSDKNFLLIVMNEEARNTLVKHFNLEDEMRLRIVTWGELARREIN